MKTRVFILAVMLCCVTLWAHPGHDHNQTPHSQLEAPEVMMEALGVFTGVGSYMTFAAIGSLVDAHQGGVYDDELTLSIINEYISFNQMVVGYLQVFVENEQIAAEDKEIMEQLGVAYMLMNEQLMAYGRFLKDGDEKQLDVYAQQRTAAWDVIADIYGFEQEGRE